MAVQKVAKNAHSWCLTSPLRVLTLILAAFSLGCVVGNWRCRAEDDVGNAIAGGLNAQTAPKAVSAETQIASATHSPLRPVAPTAASETQQQSVPDAALKFLPARDGPPLIHVCYSPEDTDSQLSFMIRSMRSILVSATPATRARLVFHIFGDKLKKLDGHLAMLKAKGDKPKAIKVYRGATDVVPKKRKVHSNLKKLGKAEVYVRFYIPSIVDKTVDKFLYLDTDTAVLSDIAATYDSVLRGKWTLAAGVQNHSLCTLGKMLTLSDPRLKSLGIQEKDACLSGGAFFVDRWRWLKENRTERWQHWIEENYKKKLYYLGCMPPQMIDFHKQWEQLPQTMIRDWKGHKCCPPDFGGPMLLNDQSVIVHPLKKLKDPGSLRRYFEIDGAVAGHEP